MSRALREAEIWSQNLMIRNNLEKKIVDLEKENKNLKKRVKDLNKKFKIELKYACAYRQVLAANGLLEATHKIMDKI